MNGKLKTWFAGLTAVGKTAIVAVSSVVLLGGIGAVANPCNDAAVYTNKTVTETSQFKTIDTKDPTMNVGETKVTKAGVDGQNQVTYRIGTKCNKQVSKDATKSAVKTEPTSQEQLVGDKVVTTETQDAPIPFTNQNVNDSTMDQGTSKVVQAGVNGSKKVTYEVVKADGQEQGRTQTSEAVTLQPVPQITRIGTKTAAPAATQSNCDPNYTPCIPYYSGNALNCGDIRMEVRVIGTDHNRFDADGDSYGCESYR